GLNLPSEIVLPVAYHGVVKLPDLFKTPAYVVAEHDTEFAIDRLQITNVRLRTFFDRTLEILQVALVNHIAVSQFPDALVQLVGGPSKVLVLGYNPKFGDLAF